MTWQLTQVANTFLFSLVFQPCGKHFWRVSNCVQDLRMCAATVLVSAPCGPQRLRTDKTKPPKQIAGGSEMCHPQVLFETNREIWRDLLSTRLKKQARLFFKFIFILQFYWLDCVWRLQPWTRRRGEGAGGRTRTARSLWVVSGHEAPESHQHKERHWSRKSVV